MEWRSINYQYQQRLNRLDVEPSFALHKDFSLVDWNIKNLEKFHATWINHWKKTDAFEWENKNFRKYPVQLNPDQKNYVQNFTSNSNNGILTDILQKLNDKIDRNNSSYRHTTCSSDCSCSRSKSHSSSRNYSQRHKHRSKNMAHFASDISRAQNDTKKSDMSTDEAETSASANPLNDLNVLKGTKPDEKTSFTAL